MRIISRLLSLLVKFGFHKNKYLVSMYAKILELSNVKYKVVRIQDQLIKVDLPFALSLSIYGTYFSERMMSKLFLNEIKPEMVVVDIGAHMGYYTLLAAKLAKTVYAFEPEPNNFKVLRENVERNKHSNIILINKAVSDNTGDAELFLSKCAGNHTLAYTSLKAHINIKTVDLNSYFKNTQIDIIKVDVEGAEPLVLKGMSDVLAYNSRMVLFTEFNPKLIYNMGYTPLEYLNKIAYYGFKIYMINEQKQIMEVYSNADILKNCNSYVNLFCRKGF